MNKVHAIYDGEDFVEGFWWDLAHAANRAVELGRGAVRSFEVKDAPDTTRPFADALAFVRNVMERAYLEELISKVQRLREGARLAGMGERHLRRLLAHHGFKTRFALRKRRSFRLLPDGSPDAGALPALAVETAPNDEVPA